MTWSRKSTSSCCVIPQTSVNELFPGMPQRLWVGAKDGAALSSRSRFQGESKSRVYAVECIPEILQSQQGSGTF